jgi:hypothetical protein
MIERSNSVSGQQVRRWHAQIRRMAEEDSTAANDSIHVPGHGVLQIRYSVRINCNVIRAKAPIGVRPMLPWVAKAKGRHLSSGADYLAVRKPFWWVFCLSQLVRIAA